MTYRAKTAYQEKNIAKGYDDRRFSSVKGKLVDAAEKWIICNILFANGIQKDSKILDIPCGTGRLSLCLVKKGYRVTGVDISEAMIGEATEKLKKTAYNDAVNFTVGNAESLNLASYSFDAAVCLRLLGHTPPEIRRKIISELMRVSKKIAILVYYHKGSIQNILRSHGRKARGVMWYPVSFTQIRQELSSLGLNIRAIRPLLLGVSESLFVVAEKT